LTLLILLLGIGLPIAILLIAPAVPAIRRMAEVDRPKARRIHVSPAVLVINEHGKADFEPGNVLTAHSTSETYRYWWQRQPMRTGDEVLSVNELALSPVEVVQDSSSLFHDQKPPRFKVRDRKHPGLASRYGSPVPAFEQGGLAER
jgi:hypothetical protein